MENMSRKERERAARKELIIDAAEQVISEQGFENATMDEIAERAEVGKGTLYLYFKNKAAIYLAICERGSRSLNQQMSKVLALDITGLEMVEKIGGTYLNFIRSSPLYFHAFNYYESLLDDNILTDQIMAKKCEENAGEAMAYITRAIQIGMQDGSIDDSYNPKELGVIIWGASKGIIHMAFLKQKGSQFSFLDEVNISLESMVQNFIQLLGSGMGVNDR
ncbi:MAG: TetR/AcrR family transcriptional regulator [Balneolaceae bacterium]